MNSHSFRITLPTVLYITTPPAWELFFTMTWCIWTLAQLLKYRATLKLRRTVQLESDEKFLVVLLCKAPHRKNFNDFKKMLLEFKKARPTSLDSSHLIVGIIGYMSLLPNMAILSSLVNNTGFVKGYVAVGEARWNLTELCLEKLKAKSRVWHGTSDTPPSSGG